MNWVRNLDFKAATWLSTSFYKKKRKRPYEWLLKPKVMGWITIRLFLAPIRLFGVLEKKSSGFFSSPPRPKGFFEFLFHQKDVIKLGHKSVISKDALLKQALIFNNVATPKVSIIIPVFNKLEYTLNCLISLTKFSQKNSFEVIIVDDNSTAYPKGYLNQRVKGIEVIENERNLGFIDSCNKGAEIARGEFLIFLNNDTEVTDSWLDYLVEAIEQDEFVGAVGAKLVYSNDLLQEAGGIIWNNATGWNYGRNQNPEDPSFNYLRQVDYCSGAALLLRKSVFDQLNGFNIDFRPAYYEDTDLCFRISKKLGLKVMYQPKSVVIHFEGVTSGTSTESGVKHYQAVNAVKFEKLWRNELQDHLPNDAANVKVASRRFCGRKTILIIDSYVTCFDKESGSNRLFQILKIFKKLNYHIIFAPDNEMRDEPYSSILQSMGVEVLYHFVRKRNMLDQIKDLLDIVDYAWVCRPELNEKYGPLLRSNKNIKIIYDTIDLHFLRLKRQAELEGENSDDQHWKKVQNQELQMAQNAHVTITVTEVDKVILENYGISNIEVIPNIHQPYKGTINSFQQRNGILFIGGYNHTPNVDSVKWLIKEIMPLVWNKRPDIKVTLLGSNPSKEVLDLKSEKVEVPGYINDVSSYFINSKVFVAPLRYGAGMKGKIGQSMEYGLPIVSTSIGTEGMDLNDESDVLKADECQLFASQILRLYEDELLWNSISANSRKKIHKYSPDAIFEKIKEVVGSLELSSVS